MEHDARKMMDLRRMVPDGGVDLTLAEEEPAIWHWGPAANERATGDYPLVVLHVRRQRLWDQTSELNNDRRYHESLSNLPPADVHYGRSQTILLELDRIKGSFIQHRSLMHCQDAA